MSASKEWFKYHLTPNGWVKGSEKVDVAGETERPVPEDTYVTVTIHEEMASIYSPMERREERREKKNCEEIISDLYMRYGKKPDDN